jgi:hypothetical protein
MDAAESPPDVAPPDRPEPPLDTSVATDAEPTAREVLRGGCACDVLRPPAPASPRTALGLLALALLGARPRSKRGR